MSEAYNVEKKAFQNYKFEEEKELEKFEMISLKCNKSEEVPKIALLKELLQQEQDSTAIKQAVDIALEVLLDRKTLVTMSHVLNNYRRNKRKGVVTFDDTNYAKYIKSKTFC